MKQLSSVEAWGKLDRRAADLATALRLSLLAHCIDVAAVMEALLAVRTIARRLQTLAGRPLTPLDVHRLVVLAFLHDFGKAGAGFQVRGMSELVRQAWQRRTGAGRGQFGHVAVVAPLFAGDSSFEPFRQGLGMDTILSWGGSTPSAQQALCNLWLAAISHHGEPVTLPQLQHGATRFDATWKHPVDGYEPLQGLQQLGQAARALFPDAFVAAEMPAFGPALVHAFAGLVSLADWIGSNADDAFFPYALGPQTLERWPVARSRAAQVLRCMHFSTEAARADLRRRAPDFEAVFGMQPREPQLLAAAWEGGRDDGRVVVLEAETGSGKTEAALWRFKTLFEAGEVDSLCFLLPTRVAATGIYARLNRFVEALFPDPALRPPTVLAVPGYLRANGDEGRKALCGFEVLWPDDAEAKGRPLYWAAENSKRYFAGSAVAGTIDQFLLSALQVKHAHLRGSLALRALVVVDEVHASDAYMTALLHAALERHARAGGHALLMSATLTGEARARLLSAGLSREHARAARAALSEPQAPYPAVSTRAGVRVCSGAGRCKQVRVELRPAMRDAAAVATVAADAAGRGARVLVLRNTVRQAVATQQALEALLGVGHPALFRVAGAAALHHGRYAFEDRQILDARVETLFGKKTAESREPCILVGTQTLEISVDCDCDLMITDIAPIDVLLQRLGRLHRHADRDDFRAPAWRRPCLVVLTPPERDLRPLLAGGAARGLGIGPRSAYENLLAIEACWRLLEQANGEAESWQIPRDNRRLVEAGASMSAWQQLADTLDADWQQHHVGIIGKRSAQAGQALPLLVQWQEDWGRGGWSELDDQTRTRLGLDAIDVDLPHPWRTPLGAQVTRLSVPAWMLRGTAPWDLAAQTEGNDALQLTVGETKLVYNRLGLRAA